MLGGLRKLFRIGPCRCGRREAHPGASARAQLVRALVPAQDRAQDHAAGGRRGAGARPAPAARRARARRLPARRQRGRPAGAHRARHHSRRCATGKTARHTGVSIKFSVNVPVTALVKLPIATILREERPRAGNWPGLIMEVTEDEIIHDLQIANDVADALRAFNCTLALDDFGAGYSSLARLRQLPVQRAQDRPQLCHELPYRPGQCRALRGDRRARPAIRAQDGRRGHRDDPRVPQIAGCRLRYRAGLPVRQADAQGPARSG